MNLQPNIEMAIKKGLTDNEIEMLEDTYTRMGMLLDEPEKYGTPKEAAQMIEDTEFEMQRLWGFDEDKSRHAYWFRVKGCLCPKMDNADRCSPWDSRIITLSCPFHGE